MSRISFVVLGCLLLTSCASSDPQGKVTAQQEARVLKGDDKGAAADNPQCKLFSKSEASRYVGAPVATMENSALGFGCQWLVGNGNGDMIVAVVPASYHEVPKLAKGFRKLPDVGVQGFVAPQLGGWVAGSILGKQAVRITLDGKGVSEATAVELLKEAMKRQSASASASN